MLAPSERMDLLVDFTAFAGQTVLLQNSNPPASVRTPAPNLQRVMQFRVGTTLSSTAVTSIAGLTLPAADGDLAQLIGKGAPTFSTSGSRMITLNEVGAKTPAWTMNLNGSGFMAGGNVQKLTQDAIEDWYYVNTTPDTHPMHTHLFMFKVIGRYNFDVAGYVAKYGTPHGIPQQDVSTLVPYLKSKLIPPAPEEAGWKDAVKANPGQITVVRAIFRLPSTATGTQKYVHHCHIVEHEDNDMMERFEVALKA